MYVCVAQTFASPLPLSGSPVLCRRISAHQQPLRPPPVFLSAAPPAPSGIPFSGPSDPLRYSLQPTDPLRYSLQPADSLRYFFEPADPLRYSLQPADPLQYSLQPADLLRYSLQPADPLRYSLQPADPLRYSLQPADPLRYSFQPDPLRYSLLAGAGPPRADLFPDGPPDGFARRVPRLPRPQAPPARRRHQGEDQTKHRR